MVREEATRRHPLSQTTFSLVVTKLGEKELLRARSFWQALVAFAVSVFLLLFVGGGWPLKHVALGLLPRSSI